MIAESTARAARDRVIARPIDVVAVKGKVLATRVFEIIALAGDADAPTARALARATTDALDRYLARDFAGAVEACDEALAIRPDDDAVKRLRDRCCTLVASPPPGDWTGVFQATEK
jgi:adenylate cyclase